MTRIPATECDAPGTALRVAGGPARVRDAWQVALGAQYAAVDSLCATLSEDATTCCLAFYQSPWETFAEACLEGVAGADAAHDGREGLRRWADAASQLLEVAARWPERVILVNAGRLASSGPALADVLVQEAWCADVEPPVLDERAMLVDMALLARLFEDYAPEAWDAYESLESLARLLGREAEFRANLALSGDPLDEAMAIWADAIAVRKSTRTSDESATDDGPEALASLRAELASRDGLVRELSNENELLLEHVAQLRQELVDQGETCGDLREMVVQLTAAVDQARLLISK